MKRVVWASLVALLMLLPTAHATNCCSSSVGVASASLRIDSFSQKTVAWSLSLSVPGNWVNRTLLSDVDASGEGSFHLFDTASVYDSDTNTTTFSDSAHDSWTRTPSPGTFPNETWYLNLYFGINASITQFLNGRQFFPQLTSPNYNGNYSATLMYCIRDPTVSTGAYCYGTSQHRVNTPFDLPRGYFYPFVYNASIFVWRNSDVVQQLSASQTLVNFIGYFSLVLLAVPFIQLPLWGLSWKSRGQRIFEILDGIYFTVGVGILFFLPIYTLSLNPLTSPILNSPLQSQLSDLTTRIAIIMLVGFVVHLARRFLGRTVTGAIGSTAQSPLPNKSSSFNKRVRVLGIRKPIWFRKLSYRVRRWAHYELGLFFLAITYLGVYEFQILNLPAYLREEVISSVSGAILTTEAILVGLSPQIKDERLRNFTAVGAGVPALLTSVITITTAYYQSIQLKYLSWFPTTILFLADVSLFAVLVELSAAGILLATLRVDPISTDP